MANDVRWGIAAPQVFLDGPVDMKLISRWAQKAEQLDYHSLWVQEQIVGDVPILEPVNLLSYMAGVRVPMPKSIEDYFRALNEFDITCEEIGINLVHV